MSKKSQIYNLKLLKATLGSLLFLFVVLSFAIPTSAHAMEMKNLTLQLKEDNGLHTAWSYFLTAVNGFGILIIIMIAFAEILRINVNTYGIKKMLPSLILAIIAANFSYLIVQVMVDAANMLITFAIGGGKALDQFQQLTGKILEKPWDMNDPERWFNPGVINPILGLAYLIIIVVLTFLFIIRVFMIYFLIVIAPLAFMMMVLPQTKSLFNQWFSTAAKWIFAPVMSFIFLRLGALFIVMFDDSLMGIVFKFTIACVCGYMAITSPFKLGGVMTTWGNLGKKAAVGIPKFGYKQLGGAGSRLSLAGQNLMKKNVEGSLGHQFGRFLNATGGVVNVPGQFEARKKKRDAFNASLGKAAVKTGTYQRLSGQPGRIEGAQARHEDTLKFMQPDDAAKRMVKVEDTLLGAALSPGMDRRARKLEEQMRQILGDNWQTTASNSKQRAALRQILATTGTSNLLLQYGGLGGKNGGLADESAAVLTEGITKNFINFSRNNRTRQDLETEYNSPGSNRYVFDPAAPSPAPPTGRNSGAGPAPAPPVGNGQPGPQNFGANPGGGNTRPATYTGAWQGPNSPVAPVAPPINNPYHYTDKEKQAAKFMSGIVGDKTAEEMARAASGGKKSFDEYTREHKGVTEHLDDGSKKLLHEAFDTMKEARSGRVKDSLGEEIKTSSDSLRGMHTAQQVFEKTGGAKPMTGQALTEAQSILGKKDRTAADDSRLKEIATKHLGMDDFGKDAGKKNEDEARMTTLVQDVKVGMKEFQKRGGGPAKGQDLGDYLKAKGDTETHGELEAVRVAAERRATSRTITDNANIPQNAMTATVNQATSMSHPAGQVAGLGSEGNVASMMQNALNNMPAGSTGHAENISAQSHNSGSGSADSGAEHLEMPIHELTRTVNELARNIASQSGQTHKDFTPQEVRAGIVATASSVGKDVNRDSLQNVWSDPNFQKRLGDNIAKAMAARSGEMHFKADMPGEMKVVNNINNNTTVSNTNIGGGSSQTHVAGNSPMSRPSTNPKMAEMIGKPKPPPPPPSRGSF
ncbi:MAG: type IV secretion system protein [Candidatus Berkelbacteria bacterium]|nr:type IV secretion system protein [Candidatus Berkelbacteria bacterium]